MKKLAIVVAMTALGLGGCAGNDYKLYAETQQKIAEQKAEVEKYKAQAEAERYRAMAEIAANGDSTAKVAAVISLNAGSGNVVLPQREQQIAQPESFGDKALKWVGATLPGVAQIFGIYTNSQIVQNQSDNNKEIALDNNATQVDLGRLIAGKDIPVTPILPEPIIIEDADGNQSVEYPTGIYPQNPQ